MDAQNEFPLSPENRREFLKQLTASSVGFSLLSQELFSFTNDNETPDPDPKEVRRGINKSLMLKESIERDAKEKQDMIESIRNFPAEKRPETPMLTPNERKQVIFAAGLMQDLKAAKTQQEFNAVMGRINSLVKKKDPRLSVRGTKRLGEFLNERGAEELENQISYIQMASAGAGLYAAASKSPKVGLAAGAVGLIATTAKEVLPHRLDYMPDASQENIDAMVAIIKKDTVDVIEASKDRFEFSEHDLQNVKEMTGYDIGLPFEQRVQNLPSEMQDIIEKAENRQAEELKESLGKHIDATAKAYHEKMINYLEEKEKAKQDAKAQAEADRLEKEREHKETMAQMQVMGYLANKFLDGQTADTVNTFMQVGLNIGSVMMSPTTGPWQVGAAFLGGFNAFSALGAKGSGIDPKMEGYLKQIMAALEKINGKLDKVLENQQLILNEVCRYGKKILDAVKDGNQEILKELTKANDGILKMHEQTRYERIITPLRRRINSLILDTKGERDSREVTGSLRYIQELANIDTKEPVSSASGVKPWNPKAIHRYITEGFEDRTTPHGFYGKNLSYKINLIPGIQDYYFDKPSFVELQNPVLWARGATVFAYASLLTLTGNKMIKASSVKEEISEGADRLYTAGDNINDQFKHVINKKDIHALRDKCLSLIDEITKKSIEQAYDEYCSEIGLLDNQPIYASRLPFKLTKKITRNIGKLAPAKDLGGPDKPPEELVFSPDGYFNYYASSSRPLDNWGPFAELGGYNPIWLAERYKMIDLVPGGSLDNREVSIRHHVLSEDIMLEERGREEGTFYTVHWRSKFSPQWDIWSDSSSKRGLRKSRLNIEESQFRDAPYSTCWFYYFNHLMLVRGEEVPRGGDGQPLTIRSTKDFIDMIVEELPEHHKALRNEFKAEAVKKITSDKMRPLIDKYNAAAQSLAFFAGFNHWYSGGDLDVANLIAVDTVQLSTGEGDLKDVLDIAYSKTPEVENMTAREFLGGEFRKAMYNKINSFTNTYFPEETFTVEKPGFPEVNTALNTLAVVKECGPQFYDYLGRETIVEALNDIVNPRVKDSDKPTLDR